MKTFDDDLKVRAERGGSLFLHLAHFCKDQTLTMQEMRALLDGSSIKRSCFDLSPQGAGRLREAMGLTKADWMIAHPRGLVGSLTRVPSMVSQLRYCPRCLATGWHSALFQHLALRSCPQHGVPLATGCPRCGTPIVPTPATLVEHHLFCPDCCESLVGPRIGPLQTDVGRFVAARTALQRPAQASVAVWPYDRCGDNCLDSSSRLNAVAMHLTWSKDRIRGLRVFDHLTVPLPGGKIATHSDYTRRYAFDYTVMALKSLMGVVLREAGSSAIRACGTRLRWGHYIDGDELPVVAVAFWQTVLALNMPRSFDEVPAELHPAWTHPASGWLPDQTEVLQQTIQALVAAMYVNNLLQARKYSSLANIRWDGGVQTTAPNVLPAWWIEGRHQSATWVLRTRLNEETLSRLIRRYKRRVISTLT